MPDITLQNKNGRIVGINESGSEVAVPLEDIDVRQAAIASVNNIECITEASDLPTPSGGAHQLEDATAYYLNGDVVSSSYIQLGTRTPILGSHGSLDTFTYTGGSGAAIRGTNSGLFMANCSISAPGADIFDLTGDQTTEMLVESVSFSDFADIANISSLGTIDGMRVPAFKGCDFADIDGGVIFDGSPEKIFFEGCPFRDITAAGVKIIELAATLDCEIVKLSTDCYIKNVQADTEVVHVNAGGEPTRYLKVINVDLLDASLTTSNVITGALNQDSDGVIVSESYPLRNSEVTVDASLDSATTVVGSGAGITGVTGVGGSNISSNITVQASERMESTTNGVIEYTAEEPRAKLVFVDAAITGANTTAAVYVQKNGSPITYTRKPVFLNTASDISNTMAIAKVNFAQGDTVSGAIENEGGSTDLDVEAFSINI